MPARHVRRAKLLSGCHVASTGGTRADRERVYTYVYRLRYTRVVQLDLYTAKLHIPGPRIHADRELLARMITCCLCSRSQTR